MARASAWSMSCVGICGIAATMTMGLAAVGAARAAENAASGAPKPGAEAAAEQFESPQDILKHLTSKLGGLASRKDVPSPAELVRQLVSAKTASVETLPDPRQKLTAEAVYARARRSVVVIAGLNKEKKRHEGRVYCATGFVIRKDGIVVTNYHVVDAFEDSKAIGVMTDDRRVLAIKAVLAADKANDIAVLKVEADDLPPLPVAGSVPVGATIYCLSHPALNGQESEYGFYSFTPGIVSGKFRPRFGARAPLDVLTVTADYAKGSSGAPILNEHGAVVAVVSSSLAIYYDEADQDVQMVWKFTHPSSSLLALLRADK